MQLLKGKQNPRNGALNAAASSRADAPHVISSFSSIFTRFEMREILFLPLRCWMDGPSRPSDSPAPMESTPPANFAASTSAISG